MERPAIRTLDEYTRLFVDADFWRPYVGAIGARHCLDVSEDIQAGTPGTFPVFIVAGRYVVKLFGPFFHGDAQFATERELFRLLAAEPRIPSPELVGSGQLFADDGWPWPYLIATVVPGEPLAALNQRLGHEDLEGICSALGGVVHHLHGLEPALAGRLDATGGWYRRFLERQRDRCVERHRSWSTLPSTLLEQIEDYVPSNQDLMARGEDLRLLHADLHADHVYVARDGGGWTLTGIIDFGDAMVGDPVYELVAFHLGLCGGDGDLLSSFVRGYGGNRWENGDFVRRAMSLTLLHEFNVLEGLAPPFPRLDEFATLEELADRLWRLDGTAGDHIAPGRCLRH